MGRHDERFYTRWHVIASIGTLLFAISLLAVIFFPAVLPGIHRLVVDERITIAVPYLLFLALGSSLFSIWYFLIVRRTK